MNYCTAEDFAAIATVNLTGCIVICRYGEIYRGNKADFAAARGAAGVLIYIGAEFLTAKSGRLTRFLFPDPADTGYMRGQVYMQGPWSTNSTVQRGFVVVGFYY